MGLISALYTGASGLDGATTELTVVGDNIANSGTVGFKASRTVFADSMAQEMVGGSGQVGLGCKTLTVQKLFEQGGFTTTGLSTDCAIEGNGLFVVQGSHGGEEGTFYTRNGQFTIDKNGYLVNLEGLKVQGLQADASGTVTSGLLGDLQIGNATAPAKATDNITIRGNLDVQAEALTWDPADPKATSNFTTSMTVYDSLGKPLQLEIYFCKDSTTPLTGESGSWTYHVLTDGGGLTNGTAGEATEVAGGTLTFDNEGRLVSNVQNDTLEFNPKDADNPQALTFNFGTGTVDGGSGLDGLTQYAASSAVSFVTQAGSTSGSLASMTLTQDGRIIGGFTNGQSRVLGQIILANFKAPDELGRVGASLYIEKPASGPATLGTPATADRGSITSGTLEQSNVDISQEFIRMIAAQRSFQANSKTLTTADQLLAELMQLRR